MYLSSIKTACLQKHQKQKFNAIARNKNGVDAKISTATMHYILNGGARTKQTARKSKPNEKPVRVEDNSGASSDEDLFGSDSEDDPHVPVEPCGLAKALDTKYQILNKKYSKLLTRIQKIEDTLGKNSADLDKMAILVNKNVLFRREQRANKPIPVQPRKRTYATILKSKLKKPKTTR